MPKKEAEGYGAFEKVIRGLLSPGAYPRPAENVELIQTGISSVLLAGDFAYKLKKPIRTGFLDYSTLGRRQHFCKLEVELNRRLAPEIYIGVSPIVEESGEVKVDAPGETVEYAVKMKRLPQDCMMDALLEKDRVTLSMVDETARIMADFHEKARAGPEVSSYATHDSLVRMYGSDMDQIRDFLGNTISEDTYLAISDFLGGFLEENRGLFQERISDGRIRDCHGDLHSRNICIPGPVYVFDCIEFQPAFRCSDVAKEIAFLAMDLDFFDHHLLSERFVEDYVGLSGDDRLYELLDFYKAWLAAIRGKVYSIPSEENDISRAEKKYSILRARKYFEMAHRYAVGPGRPWLVVFMGAMGTGKSRLAGSLASALHFHVLDSDIIRKEMAGLHPEEKQYSGFEKGIYSPEMTDKVYTRIAEVSKELLGSGYSVILDASFSKRRHREGVVEAALQNDACYLFVECRAPVDVLKERLERRVAQGSGASDGRWELLSMQLEKYEPPHEIDPGHLLLLDTDRDSELLTEEVLNRMGAIAGPGTGERKKGSNGP